MKTYKFKLYTSKRLEYLDKLLNTACDIYNYALDYKKQLYNTDKTSISKYDLQKILVNTKSSDGYDSWNELGSQVIQQITDRIYNGYNLFFRNLKQKQKRKVKPPNFKKYFKYKSITFKQAGYKVLSGNTIKIGDKLFKYHKSREIQGEIKTLTVKRNSLGEYFIFATTNHSDLIGSTTQSGNMIGFDFGLKQFLTGSDGVTNIKAPQFFKKDKRKIAKLSRRLVSKKKGSNNRKKARICLARAHENIANRRENFHWQLANKLVKQYSRIFLEDLNIHEMKSRFGKKVSDLGFSEFVGILDYVAVKHSSVITKIDRWFPSSKMCCCCSNIYKELNIREREWTCSKCRVVHDRDFNAAVNILIEGVRTVGTSTVKIAAVNPGLCQVSGNNLRIPRL
jgi:putative transposase